jgi:hypothetical protein
MEYASIFSVEYLSELLARPEVAAAKARLSMDQIHDQVYFSTPVTDTLRSALLPLGLDVPASEVPMRWIKGDTPSHVDSGASAFEKTFLVYLTDSPGKFILGDASHSIAENTAFVFNEGIRHETQETGEAPRLLLGPMNEFGQEVGIPIPCFLEGSKVLCEVDGVDTYIPIETIKCGTRVVTPEGYKKVELIGKGSISNRGDDERVQHRLYRCSVANYPQLSEDLFLTGCHSILVPNLSDTERRKTEEALRDIFITGNKYRLMACIDQRAEPWVSAGTYTIWHLALENKDVTKNYGIYVNGGLLVETCCLQRMRSNSNLTLC